MHFLEIVAKLGEVVRETRVLLAKQHPKGGQTEVDLFCQQEQQE